MVRTDAEEKTEFRILRRLHHHAHPVLRLAARAVSPVRVECLFQTCACSHDRPPLHCTPARQARPVVRSARFAWTGRTSDSAGTATCHLSQRPQNTHTLTHTHTLVHTGEPSMRAGCSRRGGTTSGKQGRSSRGGLASRGCESMNVPCPMCSYPCIPRAGVCADVVGDPLGIISNRPAAQRVVLQAGTHASFTSVTTMHARLLAPSLCPSTASPTCSRSNWTIPRRTYSQNSRTG